jgi:HK97 family phage prohead protease
MNDIEFKAMPGQVSIDESKGIVECFVAGIGNKDSVGDICLAGAFTESLKRRKPRVVWGHDWNHPIGKVLEIYEVPPSDPRLPLKMKRAGIGGLFAKVQFNLKAEKGREAFANVAFYGEDQEWSIGYKTLDAIYDNSRQANLLREVELYEVSPVLHGANQLTGTISIKAAAQDEKVTSFGKSKWPMFDRSFAEKIKKEYPKIWVAGGNIKGNDQYRILTQIAEQGGVAKTRAQVEALELREAWIARHAQDFRLPGVIAQVKWLAIGSRGEDFMKNVVRDQIKKTEAKMKKKADPMFDFGQDEEKPEKRMGEENQPPSRALMTELANRFGGPVKIRSVDSNMVIFEHMMDGSPSTMRVAYHFDGSNYMFGKPQGVKPTVVYLPNDDEEEEYAPKPRRTQGPAYDTGIAGMPQMQKPGGCGCGCGGKKSDDLESILDSLDFELATKAGRAVSAGNLEKLTQAIDLIRQVVAAGGRSEIEMKEKSVNVSANIEDLFAVKDLLDPVFEFHGIDAEANEYGIEIKGYISNEAVKAITTALSVSDYDAELISESDDYSEY